jgi:DNA-binding transcriptional LysR family regulator
MKLRQFQCLSAVVESGFNISRAAEVLHATQPAIGKQLRLIEDELGVALLLRRSGRPVALTEAGEQALGWARRALQCSDNIRALGADRGAESGGSFIIAATHAHATCVLLPAIVSFREQFPDMRLCLRQGTPSQAGQLVRDGTAAFGMTHLPSDLPKEVVAVPFLTSRRTLLMPPGHPLAKAKTLTLAAIAAFPIIVPHSLGTDTPRVVRAFQAAGIPVVVSVAALDSEVIRAYVLAGLGIGIVPTFSFPHEKMRGLRARDAGDLFEPASSVVLLRRDGHIRKSVRQFLRHLAPELDAARLQELLQQAEG